MHGGGARQQGFTLFHQTITTGNTDQTHLLALEADAPALCEASPAKKKGSMTRINSKGRTECVS